MRLDDSSREPYEKPYMELTGHPGSTYLAALRLTTAAILGDLLYSYEDVAQAQVMVEEMYHLVLRGSPDPVLDSDLRVTTRFYLRRDGVEIALVDPFDALEEVTATSEGMESLAVLRALSADVQVDHGPPGVLRVLKRKGADPAYSLVGTLWNC